MTGYDIPIAQLPRVGAVLLKLLKTMGIETCRDLIFYFPYRFDDFSRTLRIADLTIGETVTINGRIDMIANRRSRNRRMIVTEAFVSDESGSIKVVWFNQPFLIKNIQVGDEVVLSGKTSDTYYDLQMVSPAYEKKSVTKDTLHTARLVPVYSLPTHCSQKQFRALMHSALEACASSVEEPLPQGMRERERLLYVEEALWAIHFPTDANLFQEARRRFAIEELFMLQLFIQRARSASAAMTAHAIDHHRDVTKDFLASLPFSFTEDQRAVAQEIMGDMTKKIPMNRLLQGDVGSGKTVVAALAMLNVVKSGLQCAFMAPTEILAQQHYATLCKLFETFGVRIALYTGQYHESTAAIGGVPSRAGELSTSKEELTSSISKGEIDIIIGTHALIQERVVFKNLAFVVIDEQHRFGVRQRKLLKEKNVDGTMPHLLSMTATPIPRSLALTVYGDLDISTIRQMPKGRKKITTKIVPKAYREWTVDFIKKQIHAGRQVFILCPLIDESDILGVKSVREEYKRLHTGVLSDIRLGMLHGKMKKDEKESVMRAMLEGQVDVLVTTSVVEVGIDIPNASIMLIEGAERFGLAQLHQLRGRVGRAEHQSYCFLAPSDEGKEEIARLKAVVASNDGFALAQKDLELRGEGDIFGLRQSGLPRLRIATLFDVDLIQKAREYAAVYHPILNDYPELKDRITTFQDTVHLE